MKLIQTYVLKHIEGAYRFVYMNNSFSISLNTSAYNYLEKMDEAAYGIEAIRYGRWVKNDIRTYI
ncbi:hypothetical protein [Vibrio phage BUCT194]|uniref:Uncharacterized protein n=1 Tax=Vibrio phage BUCT194 TaxID=2859072 RepID=A0AAE9BPX7_9CAUD|nr:hypothetical protein PP741_gp027 [Vibrio phage BUCT194]UAW01198.1 hypothetical protein [Vibrio phage BUCT194]